MATITPSRAFEGSDLSTNVFGKTLKENIRAVSFREDRNKEGNFFFILPPYKADTAGRGVSWKVVPVRDNFGIDIKELFAVPRNCPVAYFAGRAKQFYPDYAKVETVVQNGRSVKRYPAFGRSTNKVLFNVGYMNAMHLGAHVLTLPQFGGGEHIEAWGRRRMPDGSEAPLLNDPKKAIPVFIQLKKDAVGQPWVVTPEASKTYELPMELSDSNYLYNLDDVVHYPEIDYLVDKLRGFVPADIFNKCMAGYQLPSGVVIGAGAVAVNANLPGSPGPLQMAVPQMAMPSYPAPQAAGPAPISAIPRAVIPNVGPQPMEQPLPTVQVQHTGNPAGSPPVFSVEEARAYLQRTAAPVR